MSDLILHGYWRSSAAYRVRLALALKGIPYAQAAHDLRIGQQRDAAYLALNPQGLVPALETEGHVLTQSPAILEWIEERWPDPPLLPADPAGRAEVRAQLALIACDIHPLNNLRVLNRLRAQFDADGAAVEAWITHWVALGFEALEALLARQGGLFCWGDRPTLADCALLPQLYNAERFKVGLTPYPRLRAAAGRLLALPGVEAATPDRQPDAA